MQYTREVLDRETGEFVAIPIGWPHGSLNGATASA